MEKHYQIIVDKERNLILSKHKRYIKLKRLQEKINKEIDVIEKGIKVQILVSF